MDDWEEEHASLDIKIKALPKSNWDDEDVDENDVKDSWEDEEEPAPAPVVKTTEKAPKKSSEKATEKKGKKVEPVIEEPLDPVAEKLRQQSGCKCTHSILCRSALACKVSNNKKTLFYVYLVKEKVSLRKSFAEVAIGDRLRSDVIPVLEKLQRKKERAKKQKERQDKLLKDSQNSCCPGNRRSCRTRRNISYPSGQELHVLTT